LDKSGWGYRNISGTKPELLTGKRSRSRIAVEMRINAGRLKAAATWAPPDIPPQKQSATEKSDRY